MGRLAGAAGLVLAIAGLGACGGGGDGGSSGGTTTPTPAPAPSPQPAPTLTIGGSKSVIGNTLYRYSADSTATSFTTPVWHWGDDDADTTANPAAKLWRTPGAFAVSATATATDRTPNVDMTSNTLTVNAIAYPLALGRYHGCAMTSASAMRCWGYNSAGEAQADPGLANVIGLSAGDGDTCALLADGSVTCWGSNTRGQVGIGSLSETEPAPKVVTGLSHVISLSSSGTGTCAVRADHTVACWGNHRTADQDPAQYDALPIDHDGAIISPTDVPGLAGVASVVLSTDFGCAVKTDGSAVCWGRNDHGQVGDGTLVTRADTPTAVVGIGGTGTLSNVASMALTELSSCALRTDGTVACWGFNSYGALGNGGGTDSATPVLVAGLNDAIALAAGVSNVCALRSTGAVTCWGDNSSGQLGDGGVSTGYGPVTVAGLSNAAALAAQPTDGQTFCVLTATGALQCWGRNGSGEGANDGLALPVLNAPTAASTVSASWFKP